MFVSKERRGLVANATIPPDQPLIEFRGSVYAVHEFNGRSKSGRFFPFCLFYKALPKGGGETGESTLDLSVDARLKGTDARFVRRSCQPNTQVKLVIKNEQLHLLLVSTEVIESATELTIPFDYDFRQCNYEVDCACKSANGWEQRSVECPIEQHNAEILPVSVSPAIGAKKSVSILTPKPSQQQNHQPSSSKRRTTSGSSTSSPTINVKKQRAKQPNKQQQPTLLKRAIPISPAKRKSSSGPPGNKKVGLRVKLKTKQHHVSPSAAKTSLSKCIAAAATKLMNKKKKLKPVATADLTRRRSTANDDNEVDDDRDEVEEKLASPAKPTPSTSAIAAMIKQPKKEPQIKEEKKREEKQAHLGSPKSRVTSPPNAAALKSPQTVSTDDESGHGLSREEKKMQHLLEQFARMEEQEKRKQEKQLARQSEEESSPIKSPKAKHNEKSKISEQPKKRGRRPSSTKAAESGNSSTRRTTSGRMRSGSDRDLDSGTDDMQSPKAATVAQTPRISFSEITVINSMSPPTSPKSDVNQSYGQRKASNVDVERNVAKKRWLRQAMSEESVSISSPTSEIRTIEVETKVSPALTAPLSPPNVPPLKKRKVTSNQNLDADVVSETLVSSDNSQRESLSTTEAAELLAFMQQQQTTVSPKQQEEIYTRSADESQFIETISNLRADAFENVKREVDGSSEVSSSVTPPPVVPASGRQTNAVGGNQYQQPVYQKPKQKVKVSIDEYKKRNRGKPDNVGDMQIGETSRDSAESSSAPATPAVLPASTAPAQRQQSFIPETKGIESTNIRLGTLPDPRSIGKTSATFEELRQRIYGRSYSNKSNNQSVANQQYNPPSETNGPNSVQHQVDNSDVGQFTGHEVADKGDEPTPAQSQQRMSLMDRLRIEFGLSANEPDHAASAAAAAAAVANADALLNFSTEPTGDGFPPMVNFPPLPVPPPQQHLVSQQALQGTPAGRYPFQGAPTPQLAMSNVRNAPFQRQPMPVPPPRPQGGDMRMFGGPFPHRMPPKNVRHFDNYYD